MSTPLTDNQKEFKGAIRSHLRSVLKDGGKTLKSATAADLLDAIRFAFKFGYEKHQQEPVEGFENAYHKFFFMSCKGELTKCKVTLPNLLDWSNQIEADEPQDIGIEVGDTITIISISSGLANTIKQVVKVREIKGSCIIYSFPRKRKRFMFDYAKNDCFMFNGDSSGLRIDSETNVWRGNACFNFIKDGRTILDMQMTLATSLLPISDSMKSKVLMWEGTNNPDEQPEMVYLQEAKDGGHAVVNRYLDNAGQERTESQAELHEGLQSPQAALKETSESKPNLPAFDASKDHDGHDIAYQEALTAKLCAVNTVQDWDTLMKSGALDEMSLINRKSLKVVSDYSLKPDCFTYRRPNKSLAKCFLSSLSATFNVEDADGNVLQSSAEELEDVKTFGDWELWAKGNKDAVLVNINTSERFTIDQFSEQLPVLNYKYADGKRGGTYFKDLCRYFAVVYQKALSEK